MAETNHIPIRIGISTCLLGERVRFDGGHKMDRYVTDVLGRYVECVPVCPGLEVGMGVPREAVRLVGSPESPRLVGAKSETDWTDRMLRYSEDRVQQLASENLSGYILKSDSPSCGMERVRVYGESGMPAKKGRGLFAGVFMKQSPHIPVEEEGRLNDMRIRENFILRVFAYNRLLNMVLSDRRLRNLVHFHTIHKYLLLAHSPKHYELLGRLVAAGKKYALNELLVRYTTLFMEGLHLKSTPRKNTNVLQHILGYLREYLSTDERRDIVSVIEDYRRELVPLVAPITLLNHYVRKHRVEYVRDQVYLQPHPKELMLRNHV